MKDTSILLEDEINTLLESSSSGILGASDQSRLKALRLELQSWVDHELQYTRLQSRLSWALQGDANTKFFHVVASAQKNNNAIWGLEDEVGNLVVDDLDIKALGVWYFKKIFVDDHLTNIMAQLKVI